MWARDHAIEQVLAANGLKWEYKTGIQPKKIKAVESLRNNARLETPLDVERALQYSVDMENGSVFPAIIITDNYEILAGNHRFRAADLANNIDCIDAYIIMKPKNDKAAIDHYTRAIELIKVTDNRRHGLAISDAEAILQALHFVDTHKMPMTEAAKMFKVKYDVLRLARVAANMRLQLEGEAIDASKLNETALLSLSRLPESIKLRSVAATAMIKHNLATTEIDTLCKQIKSKPDEAGWVAAVKEFTAQRDNNRNKVIVKSTKRTKALYLINSLYEFIVNVEDLSELDINDENEVKDIQTRNRQLIKCLRRLNSASVKSAR